VAEQRPFKLAGGRPAGSAEHRCIRFGAAEAAGVRRLPPLHTGLAVKLAVNRTPVGPIGEQEARAAPIVTLDSAPEPKPTR